MLTFIAASLLVDLPVEHILILIPALFLVGFFFAQLGVLIGVRAEQFDDVAIAQTFVLTPLIFLGGVFYSASLLPEPLQTLTHFNPVYYMINLVRYGFLGYTEASIALSLLALAGGDRGAVLRQPAAVHAAATSCGRSSGLAPVVPGGVGDADDQGLWREHPGDRLAPGLLAGACRRS